MHGAGVLVAEAIALVIWLSVDALSKSGKGGPRLIFRSLLTCVIFTTVTYFAARRAKLKQIELATTVAFFAGILLGTQWGDLGAVYFANLYGWMQNASILVFFGGIGEIAKKLTFWLALLVFVGVMFLRTTKMERQIATLVTALAGCGDDSASGQGGGAAASQASSSTGEPAPVFAVESAGPHPVGHVTVFVEDAARDRVLPVEIWYPADEGGTEIGAARGREQPGVLADVLVDPVEAFGSEGRSGGSHGPELRKVPSVAGRLDSVLHAGRDVGSGRSEAGHLGI